MRNSLAGLFRRLRYAVILCLCAGGLSGSFAAKPTAEELEGAYTSAIRAHLAGLIMAAVHDDVPRGIIVRLWIDPKGVPAKVETLDLAKTPINLPKLTSTLLAARCPKPPEGMVMPVEFLWQQSPIPPEIAGRSKGLEQVHKVITRIGRNNLPPEFVLKFWVETSGAVKDVEIRDAADKPLDLPEFSKALRKVRLSKNPVRYPVTMQFMSPDLTQSVTQRVHRALRPIPPESVPSLFFLKIWIDTKGVPSKVETLDVFKNPFTNPALNSALLAATFAVPPVPIPMPIHIKIQADREKIERMKESKSAN